MVNDPATISIIAPFLNEEENLPILYDRIAATMKTRPEVWELILVDDGSTDGSTDWVRRKSAEDRRVRLIQLARDFGHQIAITAGLDNARHDAAIVMDADLQDPPETIPALLDQWRAGYDVVYAVRTQRAGETILKKLTSALFYRLFARLTKISMPLDSGDFRLLDRKVVQALGAMREQHRFIRAMTCWTGFRQTAVPYERASRHAGRSKYEAIHLFRLAMDGLASFSGEPLRWFVKIGFLFALLGIFWFVCILLNWLLGLGYYPRGWVTLASLILVLGGIQLTAIGIVGQYISRIFEETKKRPLYFVADDTGPAEPRR
ncbi:MAG: glycosyltransferase [Spartobacteria bacterium]|nr:glycosyltransferase [Spartobacteria bacterium]